MSYFYGEPWAPEPREFTSARARVSYFDHRLHHRARHLQNTLLSPAMVTVVAEAPHRRCIDLAQRPWLSSKNEDSCAAVAALDAIAHRIESRLKRRCEPSASRR